MKHFGRNGLSDALISFSVLSLFSLLDFKNEFCENPLNLRFFASEDNIKSKAIIKFLHIMSMLLL